MSICEETDNGGRISVEWKINIINEMVVVASASSKKDCNSPHTRCKHNDLLLTVIIDISFWVYESFIS